MKNLIVKFPQVTKYLELIAQSSKYQVQTTTYRGVECELPVYIGGKGKNPNNWEEIQDSASKLIELVKNQIDAELSTASVEAKENDQKLRRKNRIVVGFTLFALIAIGGFATYANVHNAIALLGDAANTSEKIAAIVFGTYLSFCFAYFALLGEHGKTRTTAYLLGLDVVAHFMVAKGVVSFDINWIALVYAAYYAAQLVISMIAVSRLAKNVNFMQSIFGSEPA